MDRFIWGGIAGVSLVALAAGGWFAFSTTRPDSSLTENLLNPEPAPEAVAESEPPPETFMTTDQPLADDTLLGHRRYEEADPETLVPVAADSSILLKESAAAAFVDMQADAARVGIGLAPLSGFRTLEDQRYLFFEIKAERGQNASERAEVSAPPGHSEHHTGYAIDIGDPDYPGTHLSVSFEETPAFAWLEQNAAFYGFELSFTKNNPQGVTYEPWHWRYVGDQDSLETFYKPQPQPSISVSQ
jgi:D-alanyl-D-alanine carboxypeptidase